MKRSVEVIILLLILALAAYLRLANLTDNPGWYTDEGTNLDVAQHLLAGQMQYMVLGQSTLLVSRLPLFEGLLAVLLGIFGGGITTLRVLTGLFGVLSVGMLYLVVRRTQTRANDSRILAPLSALLLAIYPQAVLYSRFGFSYNQDAPLVLLTYLGLSEYLKTTRRVWLVIAAAAVGIGTITDIWMIAIILPFMLIVAARCWRDLLWSLPLAAVPFGVYSLSMLATVPDAFLFDLRFVLFRVGNVPIGMQIASVAVNYTRLLSQDFWILSGVLGLFLLRSARLRWVSLLLFLLPLAIIGRTSSLYDLSFYYMIPLLPLIALGVATLLYMGVPFLWRLLDADLLSLTNQRRFSPMLAHIGTGIVILFVVVAPLLITANRMGQSIRDGFTTTFDPVLISGVDARQVAQYVNDHAQADDLVIVSPAIGWLLHAHTADFQMALAAAGQATVHMPAGISPARFIYNARFEQARYVIIDNIWRAWAVFNVSGVDEMIRQAERWPMVFESGSVRVYRNPER